MPVGLNLKTVPQPTPLQKLFPPPAVVVPAGGSVKTTFELGRYIGFVYPGRYSVKAVLVNHPGLAQRDRTLDFSLLTPAGVKGRELRAGFQLQGGASREDFLRYCSSLSFGSLSPRMPFVGPEASGGFIQRHFDPQTWYGQRGAYAASHEVAWPTDRFPLPWTAYFLRTNWLICTRPTSVIPKVEWAEEASPAELEQIDGQYDLRHSFVHVDFIPAK